MLSRLVFEASAVSTAAVLLAVAPRPCTAALPTLTLDPANRAPATLSKPAVYRPASGGAGIAEAAASALAVPAAVSPLRVPSGSISNCSAITHLLSSSSHFFTTTDLVSTSRSSTRRVCVLICAAAVSATVPISSCIARSAEACSRTSSPPITLASPSTRSPYPTALGDAAPDKHAQLPPRSHCLCVTTREGLPSAPSTPPAPPPQRQAGALEPPHHHPARGESRAGAGAAPPKAQAPQHDHSPARSRPPLRNQHMPARQPPGRGQTHQSAYRGAAAPPATSTVASSPTTHGSAAGDSPPTMASSYLPCPTKALVKSDGFKPPRLLKFANHRQFQRFWRIPVLFGGFGGVALRTVLMFSVPRLPPDSTVRGRRGRVHTCPDHKKLIDTTPWSRSATSSTRTLRPCRLAACLASGRPRRRILAITTATTCGCAGASSQKRQISKSAVLQAF